MSSSGTTARRIPREDPLTWFSRVRTKFHTDWLRWTYPFHAFGVGVSIHPTCELSRPDSKSVSLGDGVYIATGVWINVEGGPSDSSEGPAIILGKGCKIGRRSTISAKNRICLEEDVLLAPSVLIMDHNHEYSDINAPIHAQGTTPGGTVVIGRNSWLGHGAVIVAGKGELAIGRNSVVGANAVVTRSFPPWSVIAGNPARLVKRYDPATGNWIKGESSPATKDKPN